MPRKKRVKYFFIYKTTNLLNMKYYIGRHCTFNLNDGYIGSGKRLNNAVKKYGKENFKTEILEFLHDKESLVNREQELVNQQLLNDQLCMNIKLGGIGGGFIDEHHQKKCSEAGNTKLIDLKKNDEEFKKEFSRKMSLANAPDKHPKGFKNKFHSEETKNKMRNSLKDKCYVNNGNITKQIKQHQLNTFLELGWFKGRKKK